MGWAGAADGTGRDERERGTVRTRTDRGRERTLLRFTGAGAVTGTAGWATGWPSAGGCCGGAGRAGNRESGSRYPFGSAVRRIPRYTYGSGTSGSPLGPIVPTTSPSSTAVPTRTPIVPRWTSVTEYPSSVRIVRQRPWRGSWPTKETIPVAAARTSAPVGAPMSIPRCCPPEYGSSSATNGFSTGPSTGQVHACARGTCVSATRSTAPSAMRMLPVLKTTQARYRADRLLSNLVTARRGRAGSGRVPPTARRRRRPACAPLPPPRAQRLRPTHRPRLPPPARARRGRA